MLDGQKLKALRQQAGLSAEQLGAAAGVTGRHIRRMEAGTSEPTFGVAVEIAKAIGVPVLVLAHESEADTASTTRGKTHRDGGKTAKSSAIPAHAGG